MIQENADRDLIDIAAKHYFLISFPKRQRDKLDKRGYGWNEAGGKKMIGFLRIHCFYCLYIMHCI